MQTQIARSWTTWMVRGIIAIIFGIVALAYPFASLTSLVMLAAAFIFVDGIFAFFAMFTRRENGHFWWSSFFEALAGVGVGLALLFWPGIALLTFIYFIASWAIFTGAFEIVSAIRLRKVIEREWALGLAGLTSIIFGLVIAFVPGAGLIATSWMLGAYAIIFGVLMINTSINLRRVQQNERLGGGMGTPRPV